MLQLKLKEDQVIEIPIIDFHTHIGREAVRGPKGERETRVNSLHAILEFYESLGHKLKRKISENPSNYATHGIEIVSSSNFVQEISNKLRPNMNLGWMADTIVSFPFNDILRDKTTPRFVQVNDFILSRIFNSVNGCRGIPFCRVDPADGELATEEVSRAVRFGARGLKLHPLSQHFTGNINSPEVRSIVQRAGKHNIPILFDVANKNVAKDIVEMVETVITEDDTYKEQIKVILGHFGFDYSSPDVWNYVEQPNIYAEISGLRGMDVPPFFTKLMENPGIQKKIVFGTDHNYFGIPQNMSIFEFLLSKECLDIAGDQNNWQTFLQDILGLNGLSLLPPLSFPRLEEKVKLKTGDDAKSSLIEILKEKKHSLVIDYLLPSNGQQLWSEWCIFHLVNKKRHASTFLVGPDHKKKETAKLIVVSDPESVWSESNYENVRNEASYESFIQASR